VSVISDKRYAYGLDLSMSCSGIAIVDMDTLQPVHTISIKTNDKLCHGERLHHQREIMKRIVEKFPPEVVFYEKGFTNFNTATQVIFRVVGVFNELLKDYKTEYFAPATVKKVITGNGKGTKELLRDKLLERYPQIKFNNTDESDALGVVFTGLIKKYKMKW